MSAIKYACIALIVMIVFVTYVTMNSSSFLLHVGKEDFYSYISQEAQSLTNNPKYRYMYHLLSMNSDGNQRILTFETNQELQTRSYIKLYVDKDGQVTDWNVIRPEALPRTLSSFLR